MNKYNITLEYCVPGDYSARAVRVADDILTNYQHVITQFSFITGSKGAFEFKVDGELLFSKKEQGRHATPGEILQLFQEYIGPEVEPYPRDGMGSDVQVSRLLEHLNT